jgi:tetratricopeptide (TPR) repeat protein
MDSISLDDQDEVDLLLTELEISLGRRNLILCIVASPAYREKVIEVIKARFSAKVRAVEKGDNLIFDLRNAQAKKEEILIWILPETLSNDILDAINNFRELFYDAGVPSLIFMTPAELDDVIWKAPDFWRYRGGYHILNGEDHGQKYPAVEALSMPLDFSYQNEEELLRRKRINEYLLEKKSDQRERANILTELGIVHFLLSETRKAIECYEQALVIARSICERGSEGKALGYLGNAYVGLGDVRKAIDYYELALTIAREIGDRRGEVVSCWNLGLVIENVGDLKRAADLMQICVDFERQIDHRDAEEHADYLKNVRAKLEKK